MVTPENKGRAAEIVASGGVGTERRNQAPDVSAIMAYESGELDAVSTLDLFAGLIRSGLAWTLQGHYGRAAAGYIEAGYITGDGTITERGRAAAEGCDGC